MYCCRFLEFMILKLERFKFLSCNYERWFVLKLFFFFLYNNCREYNIMVIIGGKIKKIVNLVELEER